MHPLELFTLMCDSKEYIPHTRNKFPFCTPTHHSPYFLRPAHKYRVYLSLHMRIICHIPNSSLTFITLIFQRTIARTIKLFKDCILATHHQLCQQWMIWSSQVTYITRNWDDFTEPSNYRKCKNSSGEQPESPWIQTKYYSQQNSLIPYNSMLHVSVKRNIIGHCFRVISKTYVHWQLTHLLRH